MTYKHYIFIFSIIILHCSVTAFSFKNVYSFFSPEKHEFVIHKEYPINSNGTLEVENINGSIQIKTAWDQNTILLKAIKKASSEEYLQEMYIIDDNSNKNNVKIKTIYEHDKDNRSINFFLIVPTNISVNLHTNNGTIKLRTVTGQIDVSTQNGNIEIGDTTNTVHAATVNGSIAIDQAHGNINATTHNGNITINNCFKSVLAKTENGKMSVQCKHIPATGKIHLEALSSIQLHVPQNTNADLHIHSKNGTVTSEHYVTLKPQTTKLNSKAWSQFKHTINGTLGTGEAQITMTSTNGNIKLLYPITVH